MKVYDKDGCRGRMNRFKMSEFDESKLDGKPSNIGILGVETLADVAINLFRRVFGPPARSA